MLIANKESIICGWDIIKKTALKYKTKIIPIDSEHFSIMELSKGFKDDEIEEARWFTKEEAIRLALSQYDIDAIKSHLE